MITWTSETFTSAVLSHGCPLPRPPALVDHNHSSFTNVDFPHCPVCSSLSHFLWTEAQSPVLSQVFRPWPHHSHRSVLYSQHVLPKTARLSSLPLIPSCQQPVKFPLLIPLLSLPVCPAAAHGERIVLRAGLISSWSFVSLCWSPDPSSACALLTVSSKRSSKHIAFSLSLSSQQFYSVAVNPLYR